MAEMRPTAFTDVSGHLDARSGPSSATLMLVNGERIAARSGRSLPVYNPATEAIIAEVPAGGEEDIDAAVTAARAAFDDERWRSLDGDYRAQVMWTIADLIEQNQEELAALETKNQG